MILQPLHEYNKCHNPEGPGGGRFCSDPEEGSGPPKKADTSYTRPKVISVDNIEEGVQLILQGKTVELVNEKTVNTLLDKLNAMVADALKRGEDAPNYDLCNVSVRGTNLFCAERLRTKEHPKGIPRIEMPQFSGPPKPGSPASQLPLVNGRVNGAMAFMDHLEALGIPVGDLEDVPSERLKATQRELIGPKVAEMMLKGGSEGQPIEEPIFISNDNYILDGHHRWASNVGLDLRGGKGRTTMRVYRVDAKISELYHIALKWTDDYGIERAPGVDKKKKAS